MMDAPIKIAHIIGKWVGGGVESVVMNYYRNIDRTKIQFVFICDSDSTNIAYEEIEQLGGKIILIPPYQKIFEYHKELTKILKEGNYKIVHSHINTLSVFSLYAAKCAGVPIRIAHSHSTSSRKEWKRDIIKKTLRPFSKTFATNYMCCSEIAGRWLFGNREFNKGNVFVLNNAIDLEKFKYNKKIRKEKRKELKIAKDTLVIGHVGRFVETKNHKFLIEVFNKLHQKNENSILILVGQGPLKKEIKKYVDELKLTDSVLFLGQRKDTNEIYQVFDILLLPSLYEGLGMVLIEAQCAGLPCIASNYVPTITNATNNIQFKSIKSSLDEWVECSLKLANQDRKNKIYLINKKGYNIKIEKNKLEKVYTKMMEEINE